MAHQAATMKAAMRATVKNIASKAMLATNAANLAAHLSKSSPTPKAVGPPTAVYKSKVATVKAAANIPSKHKISRKAVKSASQSTKKIKKAIKEQMTVDKHAAKKATAHWKANAHKLAKIASEKVNKAKSRMLNSKEALQKRIAALKAGFGKASATKERAVKRLEVQARKAKGDAKLSTVVHKTFDKTLKGHIHNGGEKVAKQEAKRAEKKAKTLGQRAAK